MNKGGPDSGADLGWGGGGGGGMGWLATPPSQVLLCNVVARRCPWHY